MNIRCKYARKSACAWVRVRECVWESGCVCACVRECLCEWERASGAGYLVLQLIHVIKLIYVSSLYNLTETKLLGYLQSRLHLIGASNVGRIEMSLSFFAAFFGIILLLLFYIKEERVFCLKEVVCCTRWVRSASLSPCQPSLSSTIDESW